MAQRDVAAFTPGNDGTAGGVRSVSRALALLDAFDSGAAVHSVAALSRRVGLPRTTTLRMVDTLVSEGMLRLDGDGNVRVGTRLLRWGALATSSWTLSDAARARLRQISDATGETVSIYVRTGLRRTVIGQAQSRHTLRHVVATGDELPLWGGAAALVLIGLEPDATREALIETIAAESGGRVRAPELTAAVEVVVRDGYAISHGGREPGNSGVAVPLLSAPGSPAGLALGGPSVRFTDDKLPRFLELLRAAATDISHDMPPAFHA